MSRFTIIGENIHATRVLRLNGKRVGLNEDGIESVIYYQDGNKSFMTIPEDIKKTQPYKQNQSVLRKPSKWCVAKNQAHIHM